MSILSKHVQHYEGELNLIQYTESLKIIAEETNTKILRETLTNTDITDPSVAQFMSKIENMQTRQSLIADKGVVGHRILDKIFSSLELMDNPIGGWPRSLTQKRGTRMCLASLCWHFFEEAIYDQMYNIMKRLKVDELSRWYFAEWPRREGKTMMMCIVNAVVIYVAGGETFLVYSNGGRASKSYRARVIQMLLFLCKHDYSRFDEFNQETTTFNSLIGGSSTIKCFPSSPDVSYKNTLPFPPPPCTYTHTHKLEE